MWEVVRADEFANWYYKLDDNAKEEIFAHINLLGQIGPSLGRPFVDTIKGSKHKNMKELRVQNKRRLFRIFFVLDRKRKCVLLLGGDKREDKRFYKKMIPMADRIYDEYSEYYKT